MQFLLKKTLGLSVMVWMTSVSVYAVDLNQITRDLDQDVESVLPKTEGITIPNLGTAEYGALETNQTQLQIAQFNVEYSATPPPILANNIETFLSKYNGQTLTLEQVVKITRKMEQQIVQLGYPLIRVVLPAQQFVAKNAKVQLNVVSGHIEDILVDFPEKDSISDRVQTDISTFIINAWDALRSQKFLHRDDLNRSLLTLKSHYGIQPKMFVSAGQKLGGFNLNVSVAYDQSTNFASVKNNLGASFDRYAVQYVGMFNRVTPTHSRQIRVVSIFSLKQQSDNYYRMVKLEYNKKSIMGNEMKLYTSVNRTISMISANAENKGRNNAYGITYITPLKTQFSKNAKLKFGLDVTRDDSFNTNTEQYIYADRTSVFSLGLLYDVDRNGQTHDLALTYKVGLDIFGAKSTSIAGSPASKQGAINRNTIYEAYYKYKKSYQNFLYHVTFNGQYSREQAVLSGQKFSLMGGDKVSGFVGDGLSADSGFAVNTGLTFKTIKIGDRGYSTTLDVAYASGKIYNATATENAYPRARSIKLGVSTNIGKNKWEIGYSRARKHALQWEDDEHVSLNVLRLF